MASLIYHQTRLLHSFESVSQNDIVKLPIGNVLKNSPGAFILSDLDIDGSEGDESDVYLKKMVRKI